jgi:NAD(P)-dependent dehydrogenase (short-subunit alcohol dehydrogenase family)
MHVSNIAITGHTEGIGLAAYTRLGRDYSVVGFSRRNGYDISKDEDLERIIQESLHCEVFINNAYSGDQQVALAQLWDQHHSHLPHVIINVSSLASDPDFDAVNKMPWLTDYIAEKQRLNRVTFEIMDRLNVQAKAMNLMLGIVDTDFAVNSLAPEAMNQVPAEFAAFMHDIAENNKLIRSEDVADTIKIMIDSVRANCFIYSLSLFNRF